MRPLRTALFLLGFAVLATPVAADADAEAAASLQALEQATGSAYVDQREALLEDREQARRVVALARASSSWPRRVVGEVLQAWLERKDRYTRLLTLGPEDPAGRAHFVWYGAVGSLGAGDLPLLLELAFKRASTEGGVGDARAALVEYARLDRAWPAELAVEVLLTDGGAAPEDRLLAARIEAARARGEAGALHLLDLADVEATRLRRRPHPANGRLPPGTAVLAALLSGVPAAAAGTEPAFRTTLAERMKAAGFASDVGLERFAASVGDLRVDAAIEVLAQVLTTADAGGRPLATPVRYMAVRQLGRVGTSAAQDVLRDQVGDRADPGGRFDAVRLAALDTLGEVPPTAQTVVFVAERVSNAPSLRTEGLVALRGLRRYAARLRGAHSAPPWSSDLRDQAIRLAGLVPSGSPLRPRLERLLEDLDLH